MKYVQYINSLIKEQVGGQSDIVLFGQNIDAGSSLSGLTRGLSVKDNGLIINTQNSENLLVGVGLGLMLNNNFFSCHSFSLYARKRKNINSIP